MTKTIYIAGGCFWGMQKFFDQFDGLRFSQVDSEIRNTFYGKVLCRFRLDVA